MRTRKATLLALVPCALLCSAPLWAQAGDGAIDGPRADTPNDDIDEVIVRGQRLSDFRIALQDARVRVYDLFNELNSDDAFDVHCQVEGSTGTRTRQHVCRPQFKDDIAEEAAQEWVAALKDTCGLSQDCIFSEASGAAKLRAQAVEAREPLMQKRFAVEMARVVAENPEMQQAMLDYEALEGAYDEARSGSGARRCDRPEPPPRCSR